jgi:hypothetical protein
MPSAARGQRLSFEGKSGGRVVLRLLLPASVIVVARLVLPAGALDD